MSSRLTRFAVISLPLMILLILLLVVSFPKLGSRNVHMISYTVSPPTPVRARTLVVFSYLLHGPVMRLRMVLENAKTYLKNDTVVVVHISSGEGVGDTSNIDWRWIQRQNNTGFYVNPRRLPVRGFTGWVLNAHFTNLEYARKIHPKFTHFVFMSDDSILHRHGSEEWILECNLSFSIGFTSQRNYSLQTWREEIRDMVTKRDFTAISEEIWQKKNRYYTRTIMNNKLHDELCNSGLWYTAKEQQNGGHETPFVNHFALEGSFFPRDLLERLINLLERTGLRDKMPTVNYFSGEIWIPSYILKNERQVVIQSSFSPPIIGRYRDFDDGTHCCIVGRESLFDIVHSATHNTGTGIDTIFGMKYLRPHVEYEAGMWYAQHCRQDGCVKNFFRSLKTVDNFLTSRCTRNASLSAHEQYSRFEGEGEC